MSMTKKVKMMIEFDLQRFANIYNTTHETLITGTSAADSILNYGGIVTISTGNGDDTVENSWNSIYNNTVNVIYSASYVSINTEEGNDSVYNSGKKCKINTGADNDYVYNSSLNCTITTGAGNDLISLSSGYSDSDSNLIIYKSGDGNDKIYGFDGYDTLQIGGGNGTYSSQVSGSDLIVTVGDGKITLVGATSLSTVNIDGTKGNLSIPADALKYNGHSYYVFANVADTWESAQAYCEARGGHLAVINNADENSAVYSYAMQSGYSEIFFGLSDAQNEGTWTWVNGEPVTYTN